MAIHYADVERGNESNPHDEWSATACGLELEPKALNNQIRHVTCKNCLRAIDAAKDHYLIWLDEQIALCQQREKAHEEPGRSYWEGRSDSLDFAQQQYLSLKPPPFGKTI